MELQTLTSTVAHNPRWKAYLDCIEAKEETDNVELLMQAYTDIGMILLVSPAEDQRATTSVMTALYSLGKSILATKKTDAVYLHVVKSDMLILEEWWQEKIDDDTARQKLETPPLVLPPPPEVVIVSDDDAWLNCNNFF